MTDIKLDTTIEKVPFLMDKVSHSRGDYVVLILSYWSIFDGIDIPDELFMEISQRATQPETISRSRRKVLELSQNEEFAELRRWYEGKGTR